MGVSERVQQVPDKKIGDNIFCWELYSVKNQTGFLIVNTMTATKQYYIAINKDDGANVFDAEGNDSPDFIMEEIMFMFCARAFNAFMAQQKGVNE